MYARRGVLENGHGLRAGQVDRVAGQMAAGARCIASSCSAKIKPGAAMRSSCEQNRAIHLIRRGGADTGGPQAGPGSMNLVRPGRTQSCAAQLRDKLAQRTGFNQTLAGFEGQGTTQSINQRAGPRSPATTSRPRADARQVRRSTFLAAILT